MSTELGKIAEKTKAALRLSIGQASLIKRGLGEPSAGDSHAGFC